MKNQMASTSLDAWHSLGVATYLQPKEAQILAMFEKHKGESFTRTGIAVRTNMPLHCVCGRVRSLLDKNVLVVVGQKVDPFTRKSQQLLRMADQPKDAPCDI